MKIQLFPIFHYRGIKAQNYFKKVMAKKNNWKSNYMLY